ncbi:polysaccharide deacetylase family protein [Marinobacter mobilis]|uniref:polysaccharide deacetylase family protein n=1 Tax=Marinobacter mobilis TaxID=488533 RepID=UPI0035C6D442
MYHRVSVDGHGGAISVANFRKQMEEVKNKFTPVSLGTLLNNFENNKSVQNSVVITFDDGYEDFYKYAYPILRELNIPATIFITTGFVNGDLWLWPDQIRYALESISNEIDFIKFGDVEVDLRDGIDQAWEKIADYCLSIPEKTKLNLIARLYNEQGLELTKVAPSKFRPLSWSNISNIINSGMEIGNHSHSHPIMARLDDESLIKEIIHSKNLIENNLKKTVVHFCYPNGQLVDFDERVKYFLKKNFYQSALVAYPGVNPLKNRWEINRYPVGNDWDEFLKTIYGFKYMSLKYN